jgi:ubiquinone/menaquinone biosynthesis C-methylase UbiE
LASALEMPGRRLVAGPEGILAAFGLRTGERVLEIGCGTGFYSVEAARRVAPSGRLVCLDIQLEMLQETRRRVAAAGLVADVVQADA